MYRQKARRDKIGTGIVLLVFALVGFVVMIQQGTIITVETGFKENIVKFTGGETITTYEIPDFLTDAQKAALAEYTDTVFFQENIPTTYIDAGLEQATRLFDTFKQKINPETGLPEEYTQEELEQITTITQTGNVTSSSVDMEQTEILQQTTIKTNTGSEVHKRGQIVQITGKIEKILTPPPYFFNVLISCCGMNSFRAMSAVETDPTGNFIVKVATSLQYPLGIWTIEISTVADDKTMMRSFYTFKLVA